MLIQRLIAVGLLALLVAGCDSPGQPPLTKHQIETINSCPSGWQTRFWSYESSGKILVSVTCSAWGVE